MKKRVFSLTICILSFLLSIFTFVGCNNQQQQQPDKEIVISLNHTTIYIQEGGHALLVATVTNYYEDVVFTSSDTNIVDIDVRGVVIGVSEGVATITAAAGEKTASCIVTVTLGEESEPALETLPVLELLTKPETIAVGYEFNLAAKLILDGVVVEDINFDFYVTNESVAEITDGTFRAKAVGRTDLVVSCEYNGKIYSDRCNIQVI